MIRHGCLYVKKVMMMEIKIIMTIIIVLICTDMQRYSGEVPLYCAYANGVIWRKVGEMKIIIRVATFMMTLVICKIMLYSSTCVHDITPFRSCWISNYNMFRCQISF